MQHDGKISATITIPFTVIVIKSKANLLWMLISWL